MISWKHYFNKINKYHIYYMVSLATIYTPRFQPRHQREKKNLVNAEQFIVKV